MIFDIFLEQKLQRNKGKQKFFLEQKLQSNKGEQKAFV
jgi:hypothetical protein